jgi:hypothetical protein
MIHPLYLQHEGTSYRFLFRLSDQSNIERITTKIFVLGHSRTIVGYEHIRGGHIRLLIFDPSTSKTEIEKFLKNPNEKAHIFRRSLQSFQKPVYQILVVRGLLTPDEREVNYLTIKIIHFFFYFL